MVTAVLQTKLFIPPLRAGTIMRSRLTRRLDEGLHKGRRLSLISAPAGYGKTSLVVEWIQQAKLPVAWLSLDQGDNDPPRFWIHLLSALRSVPSLREAGVGENALAALQSPQFPEIEGLLTGLLNEIASASERALLVLDDLHLITETNLHAGLLFLLEHLPAAPQVLHLVVVSRSDPPWPMARLRARADLNELRAPDLRFSLDEVQEFLSRTVGLHLSAENIAALEKRTEGWITGLQMAAISLQGIQQVRGEEGVSGFIRSFTGSQRFVLDYLVEEVLSQQAPEVQEFLLKTSLLDRLTAPLCDRLVGRSDSHDLLVNLERQNLFLVPLDDRRGWYRYHPLFSDLLQLHLERDFKEQIHQLHRQASQWYAQAGYVTNALRHALAAGDDYRVAELVAGNTLALFYSGELPTISRWLQSVSDDVGEAHFWLRVARSWVTAYVGDIQGSETILKSVEGLLEKQGRDEAASRAIEFVRVRGHIAAIHAYCALLKGEFCSARENVQQALDHLPESDRLTRTFVVQIWGSVASEEGYPRQAVEILEAHARALPEAEDLRVRIMALMDLPAQQLLAGQLREAYATGRRLMHMIEEHTSQTGELPPIAAFACCRLSLILYEWNDLEGAQHYAQESLQISNRWGQRDSQALACQSLASAFQARGQFREALQAIREAKRLADQYLPFYRDAMRAMEVDIYLAQEELAPAFRWAEQSKITPGDEPLFYQRHEYLTICRFWIAAGKGAEAQELLKRLALLFEGSGAISLKIKTLALQALLAQDQGDLGGAVLYMKRALALAELEGFVRTFLDLGLPMQKLMKVVGAKINAGDPLQTYIRMLMDAFLSEKVGVQGESLSRKTAVHPASYQPRTLVEPLSKREIEVLRLLNSSLTSAEIADELVLAVSTVRTHVRNIYGKLGVNRRMEALERARELGLL